MLSPGKWHKRVPRDPLENLKFRRYWLRKCEQSKRVREATIEACKKDALFYINTFVWQYNPKKKGRDKVAPFATYEFQDKAIHKIFDAVENGYDLVLEKSREVGGSWLSLLAMEWMYRAIDNLQFSMLSRAEKLVDGFNMDSLFKKIDFMQDRIPEWLRPKQIRKKMYFENRDNGSSMTGEATTERALVGGRASAIFLDEFSQMETAEDIYDRTADVSSCRIFNFTHTGLDTTAYALSRRADVQKLVLHWSMHPEKNRGLYKTTVGSTEVEVLDKQFDYGPDFEFVINGEPMGPFPGLRSPWYDRECIRRKSRRAVAMDLDIDPGGSQSQFFNASNIVNLKAKYGRNPLSVGDVVFDRDTGNPKYIDLRDDGPLRLWTPLNAYGKPPPSIYCIGVDVSTGSGATASCASILDAKTATKVAEYISAHMEPADFACACVALAKLFSTSTGEPAKMAWEKVGPGASFGKKVLEVGFRHIYYRTNETNPLDKTPSDDPGWYPSPKTKRDALQDYKDALEGRIYLNPSREALDECLSFVYTAKGYVEYAGSKSNVDPSGAGENHGDRTTADMLSWMIGRTHWSGRAENKAVPVGYPYQSFGWRMEKTNKERSAARMEW